MDESIETVRRHYNQNAQEEWDRLNHHPFEFELTTWMMDKYIRPGETILDIGGGPGRYSLHYARKGCSVTLADLSEGNIALAGQKARELGVSIRTHAVNCLELDSLQLGTFDHVFLMGPLYHLPQESQRVEAVRVALRHLKPGGKLYVSFILAFAGVIFDLRNAGNIEADVANPDCGYLIDCVENGENYTGPGFTTVCFYHQRQILPFMEQFPLQKLHLFGQEGFLAPNEHELLQRSPGEIQTWLTLARRYLELPELLSYSEHAMYIGRKK